MTRVLILGCGDVGNEVGKILVKNGHSVYGGKRNPKNLPTSISPLRIDVLKPETFCAIPSKMDQIIYCLAPSERTENAYRKIYVEGLKNIVDFFENQSHRPNRILFVSSTSVYGQNDGSWVDEYSETTPTHFTGKIHLEAERIAAKSAISSTVIRFSGIYGPGRYRLIKKALSQDDKNTDSLQFTNRIHRDDCAGFISHLIEQEKTEPIYLGVDNAPVPMDEVIEWVQQQIQKTHPQHALSPQQSTKKITSNSRNGSNKRCTNKLLKNAGYTLIYPSYKEGYEKIIEQYMKQLRENAQPQTSQSNSPLKKA